MFLTSVTILILQWVSVVLTDAPWPYIQVYPPVNTSDDRTPLYFGLMLSIIGFPSIRAAPGIQIALDSINSDPSILPGYSLHYTLSDSQVVIELDIAIKIVLATIILLIFCAFKHQYSLDIFNYTTV